MDIMAPAADLDRRLIDEEAAANPGFGKRIAATLSRPNGAKLVRLSAQKAIANEFDPRLFPESRGEWGRLRRYANELVKSMPGIIEKEVERIPFQVKMEMVRRIAHGQQPVIMVGHEGMGELGQFEIIAQLVGAAAGAASSIYSAKITSSAQTDIAKIQAQTAMKDLQTQIQLAEAQKAITAAKLAQTTAEVQKIEAQTAAIKAGTTAAEAGTVAGTLTKDIGGGVPLWVLPVALGVLGFVLYFVFKKG